MSLVKDFMGSSVLERTLFASSSKLFLNNNLKKPNQFLIRPNLVPLEKRKVVHLRKGVRGPVAAISEDLVRILPPVAAAEKPVQFKVRAVVTVRNKNKEDFKETFVKHLDALTDQIGRNVVLELVSTEIDPSKLIFFYLCLYDFCFNASKSDLYRFLHRYILWVINLFSFPLLGS